MLAAAILTGGQARRFQGRDKSRLPAFPGGPSILDQQIEMLGPIASEILIVTSTERADDFAGRPGPPPVRVVIDRYPRSGPLGAVVTALESTDARAVVVLAGDMPSMTAAIIAAIARRHAASGADVTAPESARGLEPLAAVYAQSACAHLRAALASGDLSLRHALQTLRLERVAAAALDASGDSGRAFRNINAPGDL